MNKIYLLLGSNLDDRWALLETARREISLRVGRITRESSVYETEPWGFRSENRFLNQVLAIDSGLEPGELLKELLSIEHLLGRIRSGNGYESRRIDIDILFFNDQVIRMENLTVPHPRVHERSFALIPLCELAPEMIHPELSRSILELAKDCNDRVEVSIYEKSR